MSNQIDNSWIVLIYLLVVRHIGQNQEIFLMADRKLKVYHSFRTSDKKVVPKVRLMGQWLEQSGFKIGKQVQVTTLGNQQ